VVHRPHGKTEPKPYAKRPAGVAQIGLAVGDHVTRRGTSTGYKGELMNRGSGYATPKGISDPVKARWASVVGAPSMKPGRNARLAPSILASLAYLQPKASGPIRIRIAKSEQRK
jgi:hypothetical protein